MSNDSLEIRRAWGDYYLTEALKALTASQNCFMELGAEQQRIVELKRQLLDLMAVCKSNTESGVGFDKVYCAHCSHGPVKNVDLIQVYPCGCRICATCHKNDPRAGYNCICLE